MKIKWDEWRGHFDGTHVFYAKHFWDRWGVRISLHKMVGPDMEECYHTHSAHAIRIILKEGYIEEYPNGKIKFRCPGYVGWVKPSLAHRIDTLLGKASYSLWIRFKKIAEVKLIGKGWNK